MNKPIVIFGTGIVAQTVYHYFKKQGITIAAFTCDDEKREDETLLSLPVIAFSEITSRFPSSEYDFFIALGYQDNNQLREHKFNMIKELGYQCINFIDVSTHVFEGAIQGENILILDHVTIQPGVRIGDNTFIWSQAMVGHHCQIDKHCWINSHVTIGGNSHIKDNCFTGVNATIGHNVSIGKTNFIGANAFISKNSEDENVFIVPDTEKYRLDSQHFMRFCSM